MFNQQRLRQLATAKNIIVSKGKLQSPLKEWWDPLPKKVSKSIFSTYEDILAEIGDADWPWMVDGISGDVDSPRQIGEKAKK